MERTFISDSPQATEKIGYELAKELTAKHTRAVIRMYGEMGVGKTAFVRGFCCALGITGVKSPTYTIVNEYRGTHSVFHFDMVRIESEDDLYSIGYDDYLDRGICIVEWSENIPYALPDSYLVLSIQKISPEQPDSRTLMLSLEN